MRGSVFLMCVVAGIALGFGMIFTHHGPGIRPLPPANTPAYRNAIRTGLINQLASALQQYHKDHGNFPVIIPAEERPVCTSYGDYCASRQLVDLSFLTTTGTAGGYLPGLPQDPTGGHGRWDSGFVINLLSDGSLHIAAPEAELGKDIQTTAKL